jgi:hypothetical protein
MIHFMIHLSWLLSQILFLPEFSRSYSLLGYSASRLLGLQFLNLTQLGLQAFGKLVEIDFVSTM